MKYLICALLMVGCGPQNVCKTIKLGTTLAQLAHYRPVANPPASYAFHRGYAGPASEIACCNGQCDASSCSCAPTCNVAPYSDGTEYEMGTLEERDAGVFNYCLTYIENDKVVAVWEASRPVTGR